MKTEVSKTRSKGINAALFSAFFLGLAPIFGKQAINAGLEPLGVVAIRTLGATLLLFLVMAIFQRQYLYIYPAGLIGCLMAGWINGFGSLFYYSALGRIDAGVGQLLYSLYPLFVAVWMFLDSQPPTRMTVIRMVIAIPALILLIQANSGMIDIWGVVMMLIAAALYALHLPINQRVLLDMPAPTVTLYTLASMSAIVVPVYLFSGSLSELPAISSSAVWWPMLGMTLVTFLSRITLFQGIKSIGGMQTALLGLGELLITVGLAIIWLGESLTTLQWVGAVLLSISLLLVGFDHKTPPRQGKGGWFSWISMNPTTIPGDIPFDTGD